MKTISRNTIFSAVVKKVSFDRIFLQLDNGNNGILFASEMGSDTVNMAYFFYIGQPVYVRKKQELFTGECLVTMIGLLLNTSPESMIGEDIYGVVSRTTNKGVFVQLSPTLHIFMKNLFIARNTLVQLSACVCRRKNHTCTDF